MNSIQISIFTPICVPFYLQDDGTYKVEIPEEYVSKLGWRNGYVLEIVSKDEKLVIEKLHGFMGM